MSSRFSVQAEAAREQARRQDGRFGMQTHTPPSTPASLAASALPPMCAELTEHLDRTLPDATRVRYELQPHPFDRNSIIVVADEVESADGETISSKWSTRLSSALPEAWQLGDEHPLEDELEHELLGRAKPRYVEFTNTGVGWQRQFLDSTPEAE